MTSPAAPNAASQPVTALESVKHKHALRSFAELKERRSQSSHTPYLVEGIFPEGQIAFIVGDSGLGKTPLCCQAGICLAAWVPFVGSNVIQSDVLYFNFENSTEDWEFMQERIARHLGLASVPDNFLTWHMSDCAAQFGQQGYSLDSIIGDWAHALKDSGRPRVVIIDPLTAYDPCVEKPERALQVQQGFRQMHRQWGVTIWGIHHIKKLSLKPGEDPPQLESNARLWMHQARGALALVNGSDVRIGIDRPGLAPGTKSSEVAALVMAGFRRVRGDIGPIYLERKHGDDGEPIGYRALVAVELLGNSDHEAAFAKLPAEFAFGDARRIYGKSDSATAHFLGKCARLKLVRKEAGKWLKCDV